MKKAKVTITFVLEAQIMDRIKVFAKAVETFIKNVAVYETKLDSISTDIKEIS